MVTLEELRDIRQKTIKGEQKNAAVIKIDELQRIKDSMVVKTEAQQIEDKKKAEMERTFAQTAAKIKKEKMQKIDKLKKQKDPEQTLSLEQRQRAQGLLSRAQQQLDEEHDDVKDMNQKVMYSKVVTIRDKQLEENKALEKEFIEEQKKLDLMMEIERLKQLKEEAEREERRKAARANGAKVIVDQIEERYQQRIKD